ncbi:MAG: sulfatase, partial [Chitinivibrionales bacterium]|nr:sulfatase [Chitinivibrionales bacterium]
YDTQTDPWEITNLAGDPDLQDERKRLSAALDTWISEVNDLGSVPEDVMVRRMYPDGVQPQTAVPLFIPICEDSPGVDPSPEGGTFKGPCAVQIHCATQGASIAYTLDEGDGARWLLYTGPLKLENGTTSVRARAIRIGYKESRESVATFAVQ